MASFDEKKKALHNIFKVFNNKNLASGEGLCIWILGILQIPSL